jgi:hypothetical protein
VRAYALCLSIAPYMIAFTTLCESRPLCASIAHQLRDSLSLRDALHSVFTARESDYRSADIVVLFGTLRHVTCLHRITRVVIRRRSLAPHKLDGCAIRYAAFLRRCVVATSRALSCL